MMNTANKRASAIGIALATRLILPIPDGTIDAADRQQVAYSYAGIAASPLNVLDICNTSVIDLTDHRAVVSLGPIRDVRSLTPERLVVKVCEP